jgi:hypothetical protein
MREPAALLALATMAGALLTGCATAPSGAATSDVQQLQDLFVQTMPIGQVLARVVAEEPNWPLQHHMGDYGAQDVACMQRHLSPQAGDAVLRQRAAAYAAKHPARVKDDVAVLQGGVVQAMAKTAGAAMTGQPTQRPGDEELKPLLEFLLAPRHAELREAMYMDTLGEAFLGHQTGQRAGHRVGARIMVPLVLDAAKQCNLKFGS